MAAVLGATMTKVTNSPPDLVKPNELGGRIRAQFDSYTAAALASGSTIHVGRMPKGARLVGGTVKAAALGSSSTLQLGDAADDDRFLAAYATDGATNKDLGTDSPLAGFGYEFTAETDVFLKTGGAAITGAIEVALFYVLD